MESLNRLPNNDHSVLAAGTFFRHRKQCIASYHGDGFKVDNVGVVGMMTERPDYDRARATSVHSMTVCIGLDSGFLRCRNSFR